MKKIEDFTVKAYHWLNYTNYILELEAKEKLPAIKPGNFAELQISNSPEVFLRRPFSIFDVNYRDNTISFYIQIVGAGTRLLGTLKTGDNINLIYPLGNSFTVPETGQTLLVGGGSGIAPFYLLGSRLKKVGIEPTFLFGGRTEEQIVLIEKFEDLGDVWITTEDGSLGHKGLVTDHPVIAEAKLPFHSIYTCGPEPMMKAVAKIAHRHGIPCEVSLENTMACGFGACLCCIVETTTGNRCVCTEGPVFNIEELTW